MSDLFEPLPGSVGNPLPIIREDQDRDPDLQELTARQELEAEIATATWPMADLSASLRTRYACSEGDSPVIEAEINRDFWLTHEETKKEARANRLDPEKGKPA